MTSLGKKIRQLRKMRGLTQQQLAEGLVSSSMISQIEADRINPSPYLLSQLALRLGVPTTYFDLDAQLKHDQTQTWRQAQALAESGQYEEAVLLYLSLIEAASPQLRLDSVYTELAGCYRRLGQIDRAIEAYEHVVEAAGQRGDWVSVIHGYYTLGQWAQQGGQIGMARMYWQRTYTLLRRHPEPRPPIALRLVANLAKAFLRLEEYQNALDCYLSAESDFHTASSLERAVLRHGMGNAYLGLQRFYEAHRCLCEAIEYYKQSGHSRGIHQCLINLGIVLRCVSMPEAAVQYFSEYLSDPDLRPDAPRLANVLSERAGCNLLLGRHEEAVQDLAEALQHVRDHSDLEVSIYLLLAWSLALQERLEDAVDAADRAVQLARQMDGGLYLQGVAMATHLRGKRGDSICADAVRTAYAVRERLPEK